MSEMTRVSWVPSTGGPPVDLSPYATTIRMELATDSALPLMRSGWLVPIRVRSRVNLTPLGHRVLFGRNHPRIRRMHAAYGRRRKGW